MSGEDPGTTHHAKRERALSCPLAAGSQCGPSIFLPQALNPPRLWAKSSLNVIVTFPPTELLSRDRSPWKSRRSSSPYGPLRTRTTIDATTLPRCAP